MLSRFTTKALRLPTLANATKKALPSRVARRFQASLSGEKGKDKVIILGAAGRDFHDFITYWSTAPNADVKCFTETQIPGIDDRHFPKEMCNNDKNGNKYPNGLQIYPESNLEELIEKFDANTCALAYSDLSYDTVQSLAARVTAAGAKFVQLPPKFTMVESTKPVVAICASRTGVGKSQTTRYVADYYKKKGFKVAAIRHPMPYDSDLRKQRCQRYETLEDMDRYECTIEEREEYYRHIENGTLLFAGVDYPMILREAEKDADIILWDGGNNDFSFYKADLYITLVDSLRPTDEMHYFPGETNVRMADTILVSKCNQLENLDQAREHAKVLKEYTKPEADILFTKSIVTPEAKDPLTNEPITKEVAEGMVKGKRVLVVDDGPTLTHGGMSYGAGFVLAKSLGAAEIVDPRPYAKGSLKEVFAEFKHLENVLPAMGYGEQQVKDLEATIQAVPCDTVIIGTPSNISHFMDLGHPSLATRYEMEMVAEHEEAFHAALDSIVARFEQNHHQAA